MLLVAAPADAAKRHPCNPPHSRTTFDNGTIRLYSLGDSEYVCGWKSRKRRRVVTSRPAQGVIEDVAAYEVAGRFFLYDTDRCKGSACRHGKIELIDIRSGIRHKPVLSVLPPAWVLTPAGTIGYVTSPPRTVYSLPLGAPQPDQLDAGDDIDRQSLAFAGHTLYWTKAGEPRSAQIP